MTTFTYTAWLVFAQNEGGGWMMWLPFLPILVLFWLLLIRPEKRKQAEMRKLLDNLKKNDGVVTIGGIYGVIVNASKGSEYVTLKIDESNNTKIRVLRTAISRVAGEDAKGEPKNEGQKAI